MERFPSQQCSRTGLLFFVLASSLLKYLWLTRQGGSGSDSANIDSSSYEMAEQILMPPTPGPDRVCDHQR